MALYNLKNYFPYNLAANKSITLYTVIPYIFSLSKNQEPTATYDLRTHYYMGKNDSDSPDMIYGSDLNNYHIYIL